MEIQRAVPVASCLSHLEGAMSGSELPADELRGADPADGRPLLARYDLEAAGRTLTKQALAGRRTGGMWRWRELLPVRAAEHVVHLGEGGTPLLAAPRLGRALGAARLRVKVEGSNPTGSFKARGMAAAVSRAVELGATALVAPSAGNAGAALAVYAAAAGVPATVLMPADTPPGHVDEARVCGATVALVEGLIDDCGRLAAQLADRTGAANLATLKEPYRVEGKKTMTFELVEDAGWTVPDVVVYPLGGGTGVIGMWKGLQELEAIGLIGSARPRLVCVQAEGCAPFARAFDTGEMLIEPWEHATTQASGLRVPYTTGDFLVLGPARMSGGAVLAVPEDTIAEHQLLAGRCGAGSVSPETAVALAGVRLLAERGDIDGDTDVVVYDTGAGHKYPAPALPAAPVVPADVDLDRLVALV